jgi:hypothetical protein
MHGPDEPDHAIRAFTSARGEFVGDFLATPRGYVMMMKVPASLCAGFLDDPGRCFPSSSPDELLAQTNEYRHPPPYYAVVGLPSLVWWGDDASYLMRLLSAAIGSALLASAFSSAVETGLRLPVLGVFAAATPITWFLIGEINPNGVEIAAAICLWASLLAAAKARTLSRAFVWRSGIALIVFVMSRGISPLYAAIALASAALVADQVRRRELLARRDVRGWLIAGAVGTGVTALWVAVAGFSHNVHRDGHAWSVALREMGLFMQESVGDWLDLRVSFPLAVAAYAAVVIPLVYLAVTKSSRRYRAVLLAVLALAIVLPTTSNTMNIPPIASAWQGRYGLSLVVGVVILAANVTGFRLPIPWWRAVIALLVVVQVGCFIVFARHWIDQPAVAVVLIAAHATAITALAFSLDRMCSPAEHPELATIVH